MATVMKITRGLFGLTLFCACLFPPLISANQQRGILPSNDPALHSTHSTQSVSIAESIVKSQYAPSPFYANSEPLLLLLSGIAMFIGATTVKKASSRGEASRKGPSFR